LEIAVSKDNLEAARLLLEKGFPATYYYGDGTTIMSFAKSNKMKALLTEFSK